MNHAKLVALSLYEHLNTPRSLGCYLLLKYEEWDALAAMAVAPSEYLDTINGIWHFARDYQAASFLRKYDSLPVSVDRKRKAWLAFRSSELRCFETNEKLSLLQYPRASDPDVFEGARRIFRRAQKIIGRVLGPIPNSLDLSFGPGTTFELKGSAYTTLADKMWVQPHATPSCLSVFEAYFWPTKWGQTRMEERLPLPAATRGNRFTTVPKDSLTDRGICIEPLGNLACQLAVGKYMKRKLANVGIYVDSNRSRRPDEFTVAHAQEEIKISLLPKQITGQDVHQRLACQASVDGNLCTVDLSNASDTVSLELVRWLMPPDWFALLSALRSTHTLIGDPDNPSKPRWHRLDKFSSMGNGFTFELETLIFGALAAALTGGRLGEEIHVYGDDLIFPSRGFRDVAALLSFCGFEINRKKSFHTGSFRESCGGDFMAGYNVRPVFLKKTDSPLVWYDIHNSLRARFPTSYSVQRECIRAVPRRMRVFGPSYVRGGLFHAKRFRTRLVDGIHWGTAFSAVPQRIALERWGSEFTLCLALLGVPSSGLTPRGSVTGYKSIRVSFS